MAEDKIIIKQKATAEIIADSLKKISPKLELNAKNIAKQLQEINKQDIELTARVKEVDISELKKLKTKEVTVPAILKISDKLNSDTKRAINNNIKEAENLIKKTISNKNKTGLPTSLNELSTLKSKEIGSIKRNMPKSLTKNSEEYNNLLNQRISHKSGVKFLKDQQSKVPLLSNYDSIDSYNQAIQDFSRGINNAYRMLSSNYKAMGNSIPNTQRDNAEKNNSYEKLYSNIKHLITESMYNSMGIDNNFLKDLKNDTWVRSQDLITQSQKAFNKSNKHLGQISYDSRYQKRIDNAVTDYVGISVQKAINNLRRDSSFGLSAIQSNKSGKSIDDIIQEGIQTKNGDISYKAITKVLGSYLAYTRQNGSGLTTEEDTFYDQLTTALSNQFEFDTTSNGSGKKIKYDASAVISALNSAWDDKLESAKLTTSTTATKNIQQQNTSQQSAYKVVRAPKLLNKPVQENDIVANLEDLSTATSNATESQKDNTKAQKENIRAIETSTTATKNIQQQNTSQQSAIDYDSMKKLSHFNNDTNTHEVDVFQDTNGSVHTRTRNWNEQNQKWEESSTKKNNYKQLESEAIKNTNSLLKITDKLNAEKSKGSSASQATIDSLRTEHTRLSQNAKQLRDTAKAYAQEDPEYSMYQFYNALHEGTQESRNKTRANQRIRKEFVQKADAKNSFTQTYQDQIDKISELKNAQNELFTAQREQNENPQKDLLKNIESAQKKYDNLKKTVQDFNEQTAQSDKNKNNILDNKKYQAYEKAFNGISTSESKYDQQLESLLSNAQKKVQTAEKNLLTKKNLSDSNKQSYNDTIQNNKNEMQRVAQEIANRKGQTYADQLLSDLNSKTQTSSNNIVDQNFKNLNDDISSYVAKMDEAGKSTETFKESFSNISQELQSATDNFKNGKISASEYAETYQKIQNSFKSEKDFYSSGSGKKASKISDIFSELESLKGTKTSTYSNELNGLKADFESFNDTFNNSNKKTNDIQTYTDSLDKLYSSLSNIKKNLSGYDITNSKGTIFNEGLVTDTKSALSSLHEYATMYGYTNQISQQINSNGVTLGFKDASGNIIKLTGYIDDLNKALRVTENISNNSSTFSGNSFFGNLKSLFSGNFSNAFSELANFTANFQVMYKAIEYMKEGLNTFSDYDKALTTISYTMDLSDSELSNLGSSAVDMAKDLSMSLDNTMDAYQIYANMNTSASEIQELARPTAILSNLSGVDTSTAADQVQGILEQFHMLEDGSTSAADASMHVVDVLDKISANVGLDYAKGIAVISDAVQASGQVAYDAGMSYEQLAAVSAKVAEKTRSSGSEIGNSMKTIITRISKVGSMPGYEDTVSNEEISDAAASLHSVGVEVYNADGSFRELDVILSELQEKWGGLTDAQKANISYNVAATRQTSKFQNIMESWVDAMDLADEAVNTSGNAEANQEKYADSFNGKLQALKTSAEEFWVNFYSSDQTNGVLDFVNQLINGFTSLEKTLGSIPALIAAIFAAMTVKNTLFKGLSTLSGFSLSSAVG